MCMNNFLMWVKGYLVIEINGIDVARFLYICSVHDIHLYNVCLVGDNCYSCTVSILNYKEMKKYRKKAGVHISIKRKYGLFLWKKIIFSHKILILIALFGVFVVTYMSQLVWNIEISNETGLTCIDEVRCVLEEYDCRVGSKCRDIECKEIEQALRVSVDEIAWASVYKRDNTVYIDIKEKITYDYGGDSF